MKLYNNIYNILWYNTQYYVKLLKKSIHKTRVHIEHVIKLLLIYKTNNVINAFEETIDRTVGEFKRRKTPYKKYYIDILLYWILSI